jgi:hypothetical protein
MLSLLRHRFVRLADVLEPLNRKARCICAEPLLLQGQLEVARKGSLGLCHPRRPRWLLHLRYKCADSSQAAR